MGRTRKSRTDLPRRVYLDHGAYFFVPKVGPKMHLGRDLAIALKKYAELVDNPPTSRMRTLGDVMDRYEREVLAFKPEGTIRDYRNSLKNLRPVFGPADAHGGATTPPPHSISHTTGLGPAP